MSEPQEKRNRVAAHVAFIGNVGAVLFPIGAMAILIVPGILFYQAREWLDSGHWPPISVADGLRWAGISLPQMSIGGAPLASDSFLHLPLTLVLLVLIGGPLVAYAHFSEWLEKKADPKHHVDAA